MKEHRYLFQCADGCKGWFEGTMGRRLRVGSMQFFTSIMCPLCKRSVFVEVIEKIPLDSSVLEPDKMPVKHTSKMVNVSKPP